MARIPSLPASVLLPKPDVRSPDLRLAGPAEEMLSCPFSLRFRTLQGSQVEIDTRDPMLGGTILKTESVTIEGLSRFG